MGYRKFIKSGCLLLCIGLLFCCTNSWAQANGDNFQKMVDILPPAPNASAIIKHSAITVSNNTGSPNISIPLFSLKGTKLSANLSLGYSSTGIKVDEIASRVGMGWSLQAGGVITRTIRGWADENTTMLTPPAIGDNCGTYNFCYSVVNSNNYGGSDSEPDLYNFSVQGISGSFIYDSADQPMLIPVQKVKIETGGGSSWAFRLTTTDGVKYYFGGSDATEKTKRLTTCGRAYGTALATAWYLTKIEHPSGEVISFVYTPLTYTYETGISQTMNWADWMIHANPPSGGNFTCPNNTCPPANPTSVCTNLIQTQGVLLDNIATNNNAHSAHINYTSRQDCEDKLVANIKLYHAGVPAEHFVFTYNQQAAGAGSVPLAPDGTLYTPYLVNLLHASADSVLSETHDFVYDDPAGRPRRLSFSQDHWGYFNGKTNSSFIPKPDASLPVEVAHFPYANANRDPDPAFAGKGMLVKIVYPTGGIDSIQYESNELRKSSPSEHQTPHIYTCSVTGTGTGYSSAEVTKSYTFTIDRPQIVELSSASVYTGDGSLDSNHNYSDIELWNAVPALEYNKRLLISMTDDAKLHPTYQLSAGTYTLTLKARGAPTRTEIVLKFKPQTFNSDAKNTIVGGVRVKRVLTGNPSEKPTVKRYYYANPETLDESSLHSVRWPVYSKLYKNTMTCSYQQGGNFPGGDFPGYCWITSMYSNSLVNIFDYQSAPVGYYSVIESEGENFEGGGKQTKFYVSADIPASPVLGELMLDATMSNASQFGNGKVYEEVILKNMSTSGPLVPIKKTTYNYIIDSRVTREVLAYAVNQKYSNVGWLPVPGCPPATSISEEITGAFDINMYHISAPWMHLESQTDSLWDENGNHPVATTRSYYYGNTNHLQLTRTETANSKNQLFKDTLTYPHEHAGTAVYDSMVSRYIFSPQVTSATIIKASTDTPLVNTQIDYAPTYTGSKDYAPLTVKKAVKGNALETEGTINLYDSLGNILQFTGKDEVPAAIIWGYGHQYPVAKIVGATYAQAIAQLSVSIATLQSMDSTTLRTELNRIRTGLPAASVTSYTYKRGTGVTSITDPNNKTNTYAYDGLSRLLVIRDQDSNIVKRNEYNLAGSNPASTLVIYLSHEVTSNITCTNCLSGYSGSTVTYVVPYGKYYSLKSQAFADAQADADAGGAEYSKIKGTCSKTCN